MDKNLGGHYATPCMKVQASHILAISSDSTGLSPMDYKSLHQETQRQKKIKKRKSLHSISAETLNKFYGGPRIAWVEKLLSCGLEKSEDQFFAEGSIQRRGE